MSSVPVKPFLIAKGEPGQFHLTIRDTRHNSQGYPWVVATQVDQTFKSAAAARAHAAEEYGALPGQFSTK